MNKLLRQLWQDHEQGKGIILAGTAHVAFDILRLVNTIEYPTLTDQKIQEEGNWN